MILHVHTYRKTGQKKAIRTPKRRDHHILCNERKKLKNRREETPYVEREKDQRNREENNRSCCWKGDEKESTWSRRKPQLKSVTKR